MPYLLSIQYLRAIAALFVVLFHISALTPGIVSTFEAGQAGVDIFFVISGYVMWMTGQGQAPGDFMMRRIIRIVPLYWAITLVAAMVHASPGFSLGLEAAPADLIRSLLFIAYVNPASPLEVAPIVIPGWTLNLEMFFYLMLAIALTVAGGRVLPVMVLALCMLVGLGAIMGPLPLVAGFYTQDILLEFAAGMILARWMETRPDITPGLGAGMMILGFAGILAGFPATGLRSIDWGLGAVLIVTGAVALEPVLARVPIPALKFFGDASYALYLSHPSMISLTAALSGMLGLAHGMQAALLALVLSLGVAALIHIWFEKPVTRMLRRSQKGKAVMRTP